MGKEFTAKSADRIARAVRWVEGQVPELGPARFGRGVIPPLEFCLFEMTEPLFLPQNGPGSAWAYKLVWDPDFPHGMPPINRYDSLNLFTPAGNYGIAPEDWYGDVTTVLRRNDPESVVEYIHVVDVLRMHSKMLTANGNVGAYGLAWKPQTDGPIKVIRGRQGQPIVDPYSPPDEQYPVWFIANMQIPGAFFGVLTADLTRADRGVLVRAIDIKPAIANPLQQQPAGHATLGGYDPFGGLFGWVIAAKNPPVDEAGTSYWFEGKAEESVAFCVWHARANDYVIVMMRPFDQTVVTGVNFGAQTVTTKQVGVIWSI